MEEYTIPFVDQNGKITEYGDRWLSHTVTRGSDGPVLGRKHVGIVIACINEEGKILVQLRKHKIFDSVWSLSGDTHPRKYGNRDVEDLSTASSRCAMEDLGIDVHNWHDSISLSYSAIDPRNQDYCENELMHVMVARYDGPIRENKDNVYRIAYEDISTIMRDTAADGKKAPVDQKYSPWVQSVFARPKKDLEECFALS